MSHYIANLRDIEFCLFDLLGTEKILGTSIQEGHPTAGAQKSIALVPGIKQNPSMPLPKNIIDQVFSSIAQSKVSSGQMPAKQTTSTPKATPGQQPAVPGYAVNNQVKDAVNKMSAKEKQELITHLKTTDKFNQLKFN